MDQGLRADLVAPDGPLAGAELAAVHPVSGGCIHQAWRLDLNDGRRLFAKSGPSQANALFEVEAEALQALHDVADPDWLVVPKPLARTVLANGAVLLLPWLDFAGRDQSSLGRGLALLHQASMRTSEGAYGWHRDGYIGAGLQVGGWRENWGAAFVELRLRPQLKSLKQTALGSAELDPLLQAIAASLDGHGCSPALVHGDLWSGNAGCLMDGRGSLYDPACWWADCEVDLAMTRLFGGFSQSFYKAYQDVLPYKEGSEDRIDIYNLYHLLNHANLFGGSYIQQSIGCLKQLTKDLL